MSRTMASRLNHHGQTFEHGYDPFAALPLRVVAHDAIAERDVLTLLECINRGHALGLRTYEMAREWGIPKDTLDGWQTRHRRWVLNPPVPGRRGGSRRRIPAEQVRYIRASFTAGKSGVQKARGSATELARELGLNESTVRRIARGDMHGDVE